MKENLGFLTFFPSSNSNFLFFCNMSNQKHPGFPFLLRCLEHNLLNKYS